MINFLQLKHRIRTVVGLLIVTQAMAEMQNLDWRVEDVTCCNADLMLCVSDPWEHAFDKDNCSKGWSKTGIIPFTRQCCWELLDSEERKAHQSAEMQEATSLNMKNFTLQGITSEGQVAFTERRTRGCFTQWIPPTR